MPARDPSTPWDDLAWKEDDTAWAAGCRWLQSWWRSTHGIEPGPLSRSPGAGLVCSMLPLDAPPSSNFLSARITAAVAARLAEGDHSGIIQQDRLYRNLLSSQPACFNLFGNFVDDPSALHRWVRSLDPAAIRVDGVRFEWAPDRRLHFDGGSAFDAFITYTAATGGARFLGIECKYAESLARTSIDVRDVYTNFTETSGLWRATAIDRLQEKKLRQFWLNTLLAQSLIVREPGRFEAGMVIVIAAAADHSAREATNEVRDELITPDTLRWCPYETVLEHVDGYDTWKANFRRRYLDFTPVQHRLSNRDARKV